MNRTCLYLQNKKESWVDYYCSRQCWGLTSIVNTLCCYIRKCSCTNNSREEWQLMICKCYTLTAYPFFFMHIHLSILHLPSLIAVFLLCFAACLHTCLPPVLLQTCKYICNGGRAPLTTALLSSNTRCTHTGTHLHSHMSKCTQPLIIMVHEVGGHMHTFSATHVSHVSNMQVHALAWLNPMGNRQKTLKNCRGSVVPENLFVECK